MDRQAFLERLRRNLPPGDRREPAAGAQAAQPGSPPPPEQPRLAPPDCRELFVERLREAGVEVRVVATRREARDAFERLAGERDWATVACATDVRWEGLAGRWTAEAGAAAFGLSEADWAVAETGSVVVACDAGVRRGYSLLPPAVGFFVSSDRLRQTLGDVLRELPEDPRALPSCISFVSGPSSTADLAGILVVGVHGPGEVFVWVIEGEDR